MEIAVVDIDRIGAIHGDEWAVKDVKWRCHWNHKFEALHQIFNYERLVAIWDSSL